MVKLNPRQNNAERSIEGGHQGEREQGYSQHGQARCAGIADEATWSLKSSYIGLSGSKADTEQVGVEMWQSLVVAF